MSRSSQCFCLIAKCHPFGTADSAITDQCGDARGALQITELPEGVSYLERPRAGETPEVRLSAPSVGERFVALAPVHHQGKPALVMLNPFGMDAIVNGVATGGIGVLRPRDELQLPDSVVMHITQLLRPRIGPATDDMVGRVCPLCRVPILVGGTIYVCPECGAILHAEGEEKPEGERLECARLSPNCPACNAAISFEERIAHVPEGIDNEGL